MNLLLCVDNNYIEHAMDTILSIFIHNNDEEINIYLMYDELEEEKLNNFIHFVKMDLNCKLHLIKYNLNNIQLPIYIDYITKITYFRLFFPLLIEEDIERILYVDSDVICSENIIDFYNMDFENNVLAGCENMLMMDNIESNERFGLPQDNIYINAGVLLINVKKYKDMVSYNSLIKFINDNYNKLVFQDQDVINKYFYGKIKIVDTKYNYQINAVEYGMENYNSALIHYSESYKPWDDKYVLVNKAKPYYDFLYKKGDIETLERLIKNHIDNYRDFLLGLYCN